MGLFNKILNNAVAASEDALSNLLATDKPSSCPDVSTSRLSVVLDGDSEKQAYTFDGAPLKGMRDGDVSFAHVVATPMRLHSNATGANWNSSDGGVALAVNGHVFGMTNALDTTFKELAAKGYDVQVKIKRVGLYCKGIPDIVLMIPDKGEVYLWRDACNALGHEAPFEDRHSQECEEAAERERSRRRLSKMSGMVLPLDIDGDVFFFEDSEWKGPKPDDGEIAALDITTEEIPPKKGSTAKPHISMRVFGVEVKDISARNRQYAAMSRHAGEHPLVSTCMKYERDDAALWCVTVVYLER